MVMATMFPVCRLLLPTQPYIFQTHIYFNSITHYREYCRFQQSSSPSSTSSNMPWHAAFGFLNPLLIGVLQVKCQGQALSPFETHTRAMWTFLLATFVYSFAVAAYVKRNRRPQKTNNYRKIVSGDVAIISGSLSSVSLVSILVPTNLVLIGRLIFFTWIVVPLIVLRQFIKLNCRRVFQWMITMQQAVSFFLGFWNNGFTFKASPHAMDHLSESSV